MFIRDVKKRLIFCVRENSEDTIQVLCRYALCNSTVCKPDT